MTSQEAKYLSVDNVAVRIGVSRETIYRWKKEGDFPKAFKMSGGTTRWKVSDIEEWERTLQASMLSTIDLTDCLLKSGSVGSDETVEPD